MKKNRNFLAQAGILAMAGLICRFIGLLYRSPLTAVIGDEGNGYYSLAYNMYAIILLISSYSIPSAISKIISGKMALGQYRNARRVFYCAIGYVVVIGGFFSTLTFLFPKVLVADNAAGVLRVFAPTIFFSGLLGVFRGYFQAQGTMVPTSISQIIEQILNAVISIGAALLFVSWVKNADDTTRAIYGASGSAAGTGAGVLAGLVFILILYNREKHEFNHHVQEDTTESDETIKQVYGEIFQMVTPIILSTFVYNLSTAMNQTIYLRVLQNLKGLDPVEIVTQYGIFAGKAVVIVNIPIAMAASVSSAIIPVMSAAFAKNDLEEARLKAKQATSVTMLLAIPSAAAFIFLAKPIVAVLFWQKATLDQASRLLASIGLAVIFYALSTVSNGMLQAIGHVEIPLKNAIISLVAQTAILVSLLMMTDMGVYALSVAMISYSLLMCILNAMAIHKHLEYKQNIIKTYVGPTIAAVVMGIVGKIVYNICFGLVSINIVALGITVVACVVVYGATLLATGTVKLIELTSAPFIGKYIRKMIR